MWYENKKKLNCVKENGKGKNDKWKPENISKKKQLYEHVELT